MSKPIRLGVIGTGSVASGPYLNLIEQLKARGQAEIVMAADVSAASVKRFAKAAGISRTSMRYQDVLAADDVDAVLITTAMPVHGEIALAGLKAGKHVLVEKPMAVTMKEANQLVELSKTSAGLLVCAPHIILSRTYQEMWRRIHSGEIGTPYTARARYGWSGPWWGQWFYKKGGGALFDLGVYNVTALTGWLGPAKRVTAMTGVVNPNRLVEGKKMKIEAEDNAHVLIDFGNSVFAVVTTGFSMPAYKSPALEVYGSSGVIQMLGDDWAPEGIEQFNPKRGSWESFDMGDRHWPWTDGLRHMVECIQTGARPIIRPEHARHALEIMLAAQAAGADGRAREIKTTFEPLDFSANRKNKRREAKHDRTRDE
jgi:predicted dehydrogenase